MYDVVIVGAGPTGTTAARLCAKAGLSTMVLEEHATIGYPVQCAGLLSITTFRECEISTKSIQNCIRGARICGSNGHELSFATDTTKAYVVDRGRLDHEMAERAADAGAEFSLKTCVTTINSKKKTLSTLGISGKNEIHYNILIAADGARSVIARGLGIPPSQHIYAGIQADITWNGCPECVEIYPNASPDFFAWVIPLSPKRARIGLCGLKNVHARFTTFAKNFAPTNIHSVTGTIPIGVRSRTYRSGCIIAGDAAGFPKPISGGGIYTSVRSARHAAAIVIKATETGDTSDQTLAEYEKRWYADFGKELEFGIKALRLRCMLMPKEIDSIIDTLNTSETREIITTMGDIDRPSSLLLKLMKNQKIISTFGILGVKSMIRSMII